MGHKIGEERAVIPSGQDVAQVDTVDTVDIGYKSILNLSQIIVFNLLLSLM